MDATVVIVVEPSIDEQLPIVANGLWEVVATFDGDDFTDEEWRALQEALNLDALDRLK